MSWRFFKLNEEIDDGISRYFRSLGFEVTWDFQRSTGLHWYEIYDGPEQLIQIDFDAPLDELKRDLPLLASGATDVGSPTWQVRGPIDRLQRVVDRMEAAAS